MKIKLLNGTTYTATRAEVVNGKLEIDFRDMTAEEVQAVFSVPANLQTIELHTDEGNLFGSLPGWTVYGGVTLLNNTKTVILTKQIDVTAERITQAEASALEAKALAEEVAGNLDTAIVELTTIIAEGGSANV